MSTASVINSDAPRVHMLKSGMIADKIIVIMFILILGFALIYLIERYTNN